MMILVLLYGLMLIDGLGVRIAIVIHLLATLNPWKFPHAPRTDGLGIRIAIVIHLFSHMFVLGPPWF
jgi:hypothetical protein